MTTSIAAGPKAEDPRRLRRPPVVTGILSTRFAIIPAAELGALRIDETYQRGRIDGMAQDLIYVLRNKGQVPSPIHVVERENGARFIVDGQQRFWAHMDVEVDLPALIHRVKDFETEKLLFIALNSYARVSPGIMVRSWPGPSASLIVEVSETKDHPLYRRVNFGLHGRGRAGLGSFGAVALLHGIATVADGAIARGHIVHLLSSADARVTKAAARARADTLLRFAPEVFLSVAPRPIFLRSLAQVSHTRWGNEPALPRDSVLTALRRINWKDLIPEYTDRFRPLVVAEIEKRWPAERWRP
jgi:hypothetical protein